MAITKPTPGASDGTYGTELNAYLAVSIGTNGEIQNEALQTASTAPIDDKALANKKYVDDTVVKCWANVQANGTLDDSKNVTSVVNDSAGVFTITWATDFANNDYACVVSISAGALLRFGTVAEQNAGTAVINTWNTSFALTSVSFNVMAIGEQV